MADQYELTPEEIAANLAAVRGNIEAACARTGRDPGAVQLCAVSKLKSVADIRAAMAAGQLLFGENYVQEIQKKYGELGGACAGTAGGATGADLSESDEMGESDGSGTAASGEPAFGQQADAAVVPTWHMIGHLQRNKVKYLIDRVEMIHSVDSISLAQQIEKEAAKRDRVMDILLEVNIAGEESKWGFAAQETLPAARGIAALPHVCVRGLMTSAPYTEDAETNRVHFRNLKLLFDALAADGIPGTQIDTLSMGMTGDYVVAVEEGATLIRVGTGIFGQRDYSH